MFSPPFLGFNMKVVALALTLLLALGESGLAHSPSSVVCFYFKPQQFTGRLPPITQSRATPVLDVPLLFIFTLPVVFHLHTFQSHLRSNRAFLYPQVAMRAPCRLMLPPRWSTTRQLPWSTLTK